MHIESLQLFHKIAMEKSISKVAVSSHISQPALSQQMQKLEESVDAKLFERSNKGIELTSAGRIMESYSLQFSQIYENLIEDLSTLKKCNSTFKISTVPEFGMYGLPCTLKKIKKNLPSCNFNLSLIPSLEVESMVKYNKADVGFVIGEPEDKSLISKAFKLDKIVLVASKNYDIKDKIALKDFDNLPILKLSKDYSTSLLLEKYTNNHNIDKNNFYVSSTLNSLDSIKTLILDGSGIAFLPYAAIRKDLNANLIKIIDVENFNLDYQVNMIFNSDMPEQTQYIVSHFLKHTKCLTCVA